MLRPILFILIALSLVLVALPGCDDDDDDSQNPPVDDDEYPDDDDDDTTDDDSDDDDNDDDDDNNDSVDDDDCDVEALCTYIIAECDDNFPWTEQVECESGFWEFCEHPADYLLCTCSCFDPDESCDDFVFDCQWDCWLGWCDSDSDDDDNDVSDDDDDNMTDDDDNDASDDDDVVDDDDDDTAGQRRMVIAGDSWSCGFVYPTIDALADRGFTNVTLDWGTTCVAGSQAEQWADNVGGLLNILDAALDGPPQAEVLLLVIGGNDFLSTGVDGYGDWPDFIQNIALNNIVRDVERIIEHALFQRPNLKVVLIDYDYMHFEFAQIYAPIPDMDTEEFNQEFVELGRRRLAMVQSIPNAEYAHNWGLMQHYFGDVPHPPFWLPPLAYASGVAPMPGFAPNYTPYPGGFVFLPGPLDHIPDGIHPTEQGFRVLIDNVFDQGLENLLNGSPWY